MLIVSQDRKKIVENLNLGIRSTGEFNKNYTIYNTEIGEDLGEYATEERAKEVLKEIMWYLAEPFTITYVQGRSDYPVETLQYQKKGEIFYMPEK